MEYNAIESTNKAAKTKSTMDTDWSFSLSRLSIPTVRIYQVAELLN